MAELRLIYKSETEYVDERYPKVMNRICKNENKSFEADSEVDFLEGNMVEIDRAPFSTWKESGDCTEESDDAYFADVVEGVEKTLEETVSSTIERERLEKWLAVKSCKLNDSDQYIMAPCHPMVRLIDCENQEICNRFNNLRAEQDDVKCRIVRAVLQDYLQLKENFYMYGTGQVYYCVRKDGCRRAIPWREVGTLTPVSSARLIEKVSSWVKRNCNKIEDENPKVRIAYIGTINEKELISEYFQYNPIIIENRQVKPQIELIQLQRMSRGEQYAFERIDNAQGSKRFYNFSSLTDASDLFKNFEIVLFLDESYLYKQGQMPKNLKEKGAASYVSWCLKEMNRELEMITKKRAGQKDTEREKKQIRCFFNSQIYNRAGLWLNGYEKRETSKLGFDRELYHMIAQAVCPEHDVYLYISRGKTIGDINLPLQSICNDERYDGKKMLVYKVTGQTGVADGHDIGEQMKEILLGDNNPVLCSLDLWKLVKSIGRDFRKEMFCNERDSIDNAAAQIALLKNTFLNISIRKGENCKPKLHFDLESTTASESQEKFLKEFAQGYLKLCKEENEFPYVRNYLYELLVSALIARADSAKGLFYAYLMRAGDFVDIDTDITTNLKRPSRKGHQSLFCVRRSIYSAIQGLDNIMVRDMEKRLDLLKFEFRYKYCPDINEHEFMLLLDKIHQYCIDAGCTEGNLYLLTGREES